MTLTPFSACPALSGRLALCGFFASLGLMAGCGQGGGAILPPECQETALPSLQLPPGAGPGDAPGRELVITVEDRNDSLTGDRAGQAKVLAFDFSSYDGQAAPVDFDGENCWRIVGQPVTTTPPSALAIESLKLEGLVGGSLSVSSVSGAYSSGPKPPLLQSSPLSASWSAATSGPTFPSSPGGPGNPIQVKASTPIAELTTSLEARGADLVFRWHAEGATWVEFTLSTDDPSDPSNPATRNRVVCRVLDDGCQVIPAGSLDWLALNAQQAALKVERHQIVREAPESGTLVTLETIQTELSTVNLTDGHLPGDATP